MGGPPCAGKIVLARALPSILPQLSSDGSLDETRIYSVADMLPADVPIITNCPFKAPHHEMSRDDLGVLPSAEPALTGNGGSVKIWYTGVVEEQRLTVGQGRLEHKERKANSRRVKADAF